MFRKVLSRLTCKHNNAVTTSHGKYYNIKYCPDCDRKVNYKREKFNKVLDFSVPSLIGALVTLLLILHHNEANASTNCRFVDNLTPYQYGVAYQAYRSGQPYDLQLTAVAVAWEESKLGKYKFRWGKGVDKSVGVGHTVVKYKTQGMTSMEAGMWVESMVVNDAKSIDVMISDLLYWQTRSDSWFEGVGKYNGGNTANEKYAQRVANTVKEIKHCKWW